VAKASTSTCSYKETRLFKIRTEMRMRRSSKTFQTQVTMMLVVCLLLPTSTSIEPLTRNHHQVDRESGDDCLMVTEETDQASSSQISYRKMMKRTKVKDPISGSKD